MIAFEVAEEIHMNKHFHLFLVLILSFIAIAPSGFAQEALPSKSALVRIPSANKITKYTFSLTKMNTNPIHVQLASKIKNQTLGTCLMQNLKNNAQYSKLIERKPDNMTIITQEKFDPIVFNCGKNTVAVMPVTEAVLINDSDSETTITAQGFWSKLTGLVTWVGSLLEREIYCLGCEAGSGGVEDCIIPEECLNQHLDTGDGVWDPTPGTGECGPDAPYNC